MKRSTILSLFGSLLAASAVAATLTSAPAPAVGAPSSTTPAASSATVSASVSADETFINLSASGRGVRDASRVLFRIWPEASGAASAISYEAVRAEDGSWHATTFIAGDPAGSVRVPYSCDVVNAVHRLYNPWESAHLFTSSVEEANGLAEAGWRYEGVAWIQPESAVAEAPTDGAEARAADEDASTAQDADTSTPSSSEDTAGDAADDDATVGDVPDGDATDGTDTPSEPEEPAPANAVYRLYNEWSGEHFYTTDVSEYEGLGNIGWTREKIAFLSDEAKAAPVYRLFNPYEQKNTHHFTASEEEYETLKASGWEDEGIAWYGCAVNPDGTWSAVSEGKTFARGGDYQVEALALASSEETDTPSASADADSGVSVDEGVESDSASATSEVVGSATFSITTPTASAHVENIDNAQGTFEVVVDEISSPSGVAKVQVPTWSSENNQKDIVWYDAEPEGDGSYRAQVRVSNHTFSRSFVSHSYVTAGNGVMVNVEQTPTELTLANYFTIEGGPYTYSARLYNPGSVSRVQVSAWSDAGGQDDLVWYDAKDQGNGWWTATIGTVNLRHSGTVHAHAYADGEYRNARDFSVQSWELITPAQRSMNERVSGLSSPTGYLLAVDTKNCFVGVYTGSRGNWSNKAYWVCAPGANATPTVKGVFHVGSRGYAFGHGYTCYYWTQFYGDYLFHSIKYYPGTFDVLDGTLGQPRSLGCVRLAIENAKWINENIPSGTTVLVY